MNNIQMAVFKKMVEMNIATGHVACDEFPEISINTKHANFIIDENGNALAEIRKTIDLNSLLEVSEIGIIINDVLKSIE